MNNTIYFDESGNTGQDMLNQDQKVFVLASVNYNDDEQETLKKIFKVDYEIHFKNLKNSNAGRKKIIEFLNHDLIKEDHIIVYTTHKEFNVAAQITDILIEHVMHHNGFDLYQHGRNIAYANWIFYFGNFYWNKTLYNRLITEFVDMIRSKSEESITSFYTTANELLSTIIKEKEIVQPIVDSQKHIIDIMQSIDKFSIDVTFSTFLVLCDNWYKKTKKKIDVRFDESNQIRHYNYYLEHTRAIALKTPKTIEIGFDSRKITFPPQINSLKLVDSIHEFGVQCADLIASAISFMYNNEAGRFVSFSKQIQQSKLLELTNYNTLWPTSDVSAEALNMAEGKGINPVDFLANTLRNIPNK
tara:strand:+ start:240 stop:1313 length:1074 start_codon:yes stop_codon:yes gene_type:complete